MSEKSLLIVDSAFELLIAIQLKISLLSSDNTTLILTDRTPGSYEYYLRLKERGVFENVLYVEANSFFTERKTYKLLFFNTKKRSKDFFVKKAKRVLEQAESYSAFYTFEIDDFSRTMYMAVMGTAKPYLVGEGIMPFAGLEKNILDNYNESNAYMLRDLVGVYAYGPRLGVNKQYEVFTIPSINENREEYVSIVNAIFGYKPHEKMYSNKMIFFEEAYITEGGDDDAVKIVKLLIEKFGKDRVIVKRHPRNRVNRFANEKISVIESVSIPWEVFLLNNDVKDCILISANSTSVYLSNIWDFCNTNVKCMMLCEVMKYYLGTNAGYVQVYLDFLKRLYAQYNYLVPTDSDEMIKLLEGVDLGEKSV